MNILALTSAYPEPDDNGAVITPTVKYYCEQWAEEGHRVIVIHSNSCFPLLFYMMPKSMRKRLESRLGHTLPTKASRKMITHGNDKIKVYRLPMVKIIPHGAFGKHQIRNQEKKILTILKNESFTPDIIVSHWINPQIDLAERFKLAFSSKQSIVFHNDCTERDVTKFRLKDRISMFDAIGCRSEAYANYVKERLNLHRKPFVCYSGIPNTLEAKQLNTIKEIDFDNKPDFIYVGRLVKYKNVDVIINALNKKFSNYRLHIVGDGAEKENLVKLSKELSCENNVIFHGQMARNQVFDLMKHCSCFIMVSDNETFGMVYIEAMLAGCVTIASKNGGVDGVIVDGYNGFLSQQGDVFELVRTLDRIEKTKDLREIRIKAIETAYEFRDSKLAQKYLDDVIGWNE